jgi:regulator of replication initiation timing
MASPLIDRLGQELDAISSEYEARFAGQPRATRDLEELRALVDRTNAVLAQVKTIPAAVAGPDLAKIREVAEANLRLYEQERKAIAEAKEAGGEFDHFAPLATAANFVFGRYHRHFAGRSRTTRDLALIDEMIADLARVHEEMSEIIDSNPAAAFKRDHELVTQTLAMYRKERAEIEKAQTSGTAEEQANHLASLANDQFKIYRTHFANRSRVTRRPALIQRVISSLERIEARMNALSSQGFSADFHTKNVDIVKSNLELYRTELAEIRKARQGVPLVDLMGSLGGAANEIFEEYGQLFAGKERSTVDREKLSDLCDRLGEIARQMTDLGRAEDNEMNTRNLDVVTNYLATFEREYELIEEAQKTA